MRNDYAKSQGDLRLAFKRIHDLQQVIEEDMMSSSDGDNDSFSSDDGRRHLRYSSGDEDDELRFRKLNSNCSVSNRSVFSLSCFQRVFYALHVRYSKHWTSMFRPRLTITKSRKKTSRRIRSALFTIIHQAQMLKFSNNQPILHNNIFSPSRVTRLCPISSPCPSITSDNPLDSSNQLSTISKDVKVPGKIHDPIEYQLFKLHSSTGQIPNVQSLMNLDSDNKDETDTDSVHINSVDITRQGFLESIPSLSCNQPKYTTCQSIPTYFRAHCCTYNSEIVQLFDRSRRLKSRGHLLRSHSCGDTSSRLCTLYTSSGEKYYDISSRQIKTTK